MQASNAGSKVADQNSNYNCYSSNNDNARCSICSIQDAIVARKECTFCNGTGEYNPAAASFMQNHFCSCHRWGGQFCPVCRKKCHHSTRLTKRILASR